MSLLFRYSQRQQSLIQNTLFQMCCSACGEIFYSEICLYNHIRQHHLSPIQPVVYSDVDSEDLLSDVRKFRNLVYTVVPVEKGIFFRFVCMSVCVCVSVCLSFSISEWKIINLV